MADASEPLTWQRSLASAPVTVALLAINIAVYIWVSQHGDTRDVATLLRYGAAWRGAVWQGEWWRLFTSMFLHIGTTHLFCNTVFGFGWCARTERKYGGLRFLAVYLGGGVAGAAASVIGHDAVSAGASGAMFATIGAYLISELDAAGSVRTLWAQPRMRSMLISIGAWFVIGVYAHFDNYAHLGGLVFGAVFARSVPSTYLPSTRQVAMVLVPLALLFSAALRPLPALHAGPIAAAKAEAAMRRGDVDQVLTLTSGASAPGADSRLIAMRVWALLTKERYDEARPFIAELEKRPRYEAIAERYLATLHLRQHDYEPAATAARFSLIKEPDNAEAYAALASAELMLGHTPEALAAAARVDTLKPSAASDAVVAWVRWRAEAPPAALAHVKEALARHPGDGELPVYLALAQYQSADDAGARSTLDALLAAHPESKTGQLMRAFLEELAGHTEAALATSRQLRVWDPADAEAPAFEGWIQAHHLNLDAASEAFEESRKRKNGASALAGSAWVALQRGDVTAAAGFADEAQMLDPISPEANLMVAEVALERGEGEAADKAYATARRYGGPRWYDGELASPGLRTLAPDGGR